MKEPLGGGRMVSLSSVGMVAFAGPLAEGLLDDDDDGGDDWIQREGRHERQSGPQYRGCVWMATWLGITNVFAGMVMLLPPTLSVRGDLPVDLAIGTGV